MLAKSLQVTCFQPSGAGDAISGQQGTKIEEGVSRKKGLFLGGVSSLEVRVSGLWASLDLVLQLIFPMYEWSFFLSKTGTFTPDDETPHDG